MKKTLTALYIVLSAVLLFYVLLPNFDFPVPPPNSLQSQEPADTEISFRRAYFTDYDRGQVLAWYKNEMSKSTFFGIPLPTYLLNYPPEDAQTIIRDQTRSSYLQEVVHPMRESVYINGFSPPASDEKDAINIAGKTWQQKITVRFIPSPLIVRLLAYLGINASIIILYYAWLKTFSEFKKVKIKIWK